MKFARYTLAIALLPFFMTGQQTTPSATPRNGRTTVTRPSVKPMSIQDAEHAGLVRTSYRDPNGSSGGDSVLLVVVKTGGPDRLVLTIPTGLLLNGRRLARPQLAVDVEQRVVLAGGVVLLQGGPHRLIGAEPLQDLGLVPAERLEQHGHALLALAVDPHAHAVPLVDLKLKPGATGRDHLAAVDVLVGRLVDLPVEVDAGRADQLADDDSLGAVDDEGALRRHQREVAHEHGLALDLTGRVVDELSRDEHGRGEGHVLLLALVGRVLRRLEPGIAERERHRSGEVLDRADLLEDLFEAGLLR